MDAPDDDPTIADISRGQGRVEKVCATCGSAIDTSEWHPTRTTIDDGDVEVFLFCSEPCRDAWSVDVADQLERDEVNP